MKKVFKIIFLVLLITAAFFAPDGYCAEIYEQNITDANNSLKKLEEVGAVKGPYSFANTDSLSEIIGTAIKGFLSLLGVIFLGLMLYAGFHWMTARGEEEKVEKAKSTITRAIVGLVIVVGAYAIWAFIRAYFIF